ncbi:hydrolase, HAD superfamily [Bacillus sp. JCM 19046]|nr:hydrolase, HAD superfamily [Bacillus sp. JCM 19045]GAF19116.1 hydrolase, HAD superfamily [Bacillus sp. JCM 19046]
MKALVTDMDGTLLNEAREVSPRNVEALKQLQQEGKPVFIATGRDYYEARLPLKKAELTVPIISANGAQIHDANGRLLKQEPLMQEQVKAIMTILRKHAIYFEVYGADAVYSDNVEQGLAVVVDVLKSTGASLTKDEMLHHAKERFELGAVKQIESYERLLEQNETILKLLAFTLDSHKLTEAKKEISRFDLVSVSSSAADNLEITHTNAQKGEALQWLCDLHGIPVQEVVAIGDNGNDLSMFAKTPLSVAMANAPQFIKEQAVYETTSNELDGVAQIIASFNQSRQKNTPVKN